MRACLLFLVLMMSALNCWANDKPRVMVPIPPLEFLMNMIVGDRLEIDSLLGSSSTLELYEPTPSDLARLSSVQLYFPLGLQFEKKWMPVIKESNPGLELADCCDRMMEHDAKLHHEDRHDPHIWTDPLLCQEIARQMLQALKQYFPDASDLFERNYQVLHETLGQSHRELTELTIPFKQRAFVISHPAWGYFAERYGLVQVPMEHEGKEIGVRKTLELITLMQHEQIKTVFVQKNIQSSSVQALAAELDIEIIELDPLAYDLINNIKHSANQIVSSMQ